MHGEATSHELPILFFSSFGNYWSKYLEDLYVKHKYFFCGSAWPSVIKTITLRLNSKIRRLNSIQSEYTAEDCWWNSRSSKPTQYTLSFINLPSAPVTIGSYAFPIMKYGGRKDLLWLAFCLDLPSTIYLITSPLVKRHRSSTDRSQVTSHSNFTVIAWLVSIMFIPLFTYLWPCGM